MPVTGGTPQSQATPGTAPTTPLGLTDVIDRAKGNEATFAAAVANARIAKLDRSIARAGLLPTAIYHNQFLYTQGIHGVVTSSGASVGSPAVTSNPIFIANNSVHEYTSQASITETLGLAQYAAVSRAAAAAAVATAELEVARRGLVATVVSLYYGSLSSERKLAVAQRAAAEAAGFTTLTQQREAAREGAHADVVKAQLQQQQRDRDLADAQLQVARSRLELGVLLFPDPRTAYTLAGPVAPPPLADRATVDAAASKFNPEIQSALASLRASNVDVFASRVALFPDLGVNFNYGIDATHFAIHNPDGTNNLGYSATATVDIPVWDWFASINRIHQSVIRRDLARVTLSTTQRRLIAQLDEFYAEAAVARDQLQSLDLSAQTAAESLRLTRLRYTAGEATVLEVVDAQNSLTSAEIAQADGIVRYQTALANLQLLTGTI